ncbi:proteoglycan 4 [Sitophilus oryzae]|uniref:Proteoglycan 4 n=1 Tax=Sitophilus oryzae TaxID=7048 RepID=A0A6J2Y6G3_SITOR|nr:proteoglycan 4 [Sitophilus oryzae]
MKRPPGLWILLSAGVLWLCLRDVDGVRATSLIFGRSTTTTTSEAPPSGPENTNNDETGTNSNQSGNSTNNSANSTANESSEPTLTGIPQIDYLSDPNLPKELNGFNLSDYPFYERVPAEEIDFKCDGLHDGFYASVPHKCQVYHHCLFGTRYDFLCANYTAFDQKTFICHFVSEVDCQNSKKFWHRNDALYQAASTTTTASPLNLRAAIYTTASPAGAADPATPIPALPANPRRPGFRRRPYGAGGRRRPQYDYYDDEYYDDEYYERPRPRKRPRPRPRPVYDEDYEEYEDERYESRRGGGRRRPYRRNNTRKKPKHEDADDVVEERFEDEDFIAAHNRQKTEERRKRPVDDYDEPEQDRKHSNPRKSTRKGSRKPASEEYEDEPAQDYEERPKKRIKESADGRPIIKPSTGTIYDRPRVAPKINLPVPKNAADKFSYKNLGGAQGASSTSTTTSTTTLAPENVEDELEDEEYEEPLPKRSKIPNRRPSSESKRDKNKNEDTKAQSTLSRPRNKKPEVEESSVKPKFSNTRPRYRPALKRKPVVEEYYEDEEEEYVEDEKKPVVAQKPSTTTSTSTTTTTTTSTTTTTTEIPRKEPLMRIIKRPFLPSRGGNPYSPRGLQPVGLKASSQEEEDYIEEKSNEEVEVPRKPPFKPSQAVVKYPREPEEVINLQPSRPQTYVAPRTTPKPPRSKNPDLIELNEYDVTLNDALNPTLPNLPVRAFPAGFSPGVPQDYASYATYQRPRYVLEPVGGQQGRSGYVRPAQTQAILSGYR